MTLRVVRRHFTDRATEGELLIDGELFCYTLEDVVRAPGVKVAGETAIPFGRYRMGMHLSPRFRRWLPMLRHVPGFSHILIHAGNTPRDTEGCILVGYLPTSATDAWIGNSRPAETALTERMRAALEEGDVWCEVVGPTLREGMGGRDGDALEYAAVRVLQRWLRMPDHLRTGFFGPLTDAAVRDFQRRHGLQDDGVVGPLTWAVLGAA